MRKYASKKDIRPTAAQTAAKEAAVNPGMSMSAMRSMLMDKAMADRSHRIDLPEAMREKMERSFGMNFDKVNLYESESVADAGAKAIARGGSIAFAPGKADFNNLSGQSLLGHELSHVAAQARGEVTGSGFLDNGALEARADREGALAAQGEQVYSGPVMDAPSFSAAAPMQASDDKPWTDKEKERETKKAEKGNRSQIAKMIAYHNKDYQELVNKKRAEIKGNVTDAGHDNPFISSHMYTDDPELSSNYANSKNGNTFDDKKIERLANLVGGKSMDTKTDPVMREALRPQNDKDEPELRAAIGDKLDHQVIAESMKLVDDEGKRNLAKAKNPNAKGKGSHYLTPDEVQDEVDRAEQAGRNMAHIMLAMQLGKINITKGEGENQTTKLFGEGMKYKPSMAGLLSHGGRVMMDFGKTQTGEGNQVDVSEYGERQTKFLSDETKQRDAATRDVFRSMMELDINDKNRYAIASKTKGERNFATHDIKQGSDSLEEKFGKSGAGKKAVAIGALLDLDMHHRYFNPAIGGAGKLGIRSDDISKDNIDDKHIIRPDGQNGHMYMGYIDSDEKTKGGMMVGLETSETGKSNLLGKVHGSDAAKSPYSSVGGHKKDVMGNEYGGRNVDLTGYSMKQQVEMQHRLTDRLNTLKNGSAKDREEYNNIMVQLSGPKMSPEALAGVLGYQNDQRMIELIRQGQGPQPEFGGGNNVPPQINEPRNNSMVELANRPTLNSNENKIKLNSGSSGGKNKVKQKPKIKPESLNNNHSSDGQKVKVKQRSSDDESKEKKTKTKTKTKKNNVKTKHDIKYDDNGIPENYSNGEPITQEQKELLKDLLGQNS